MELRKQDILDLLDPKDIVGLLRQYRPRVCFSCVHPDAIQPEYAHCDDSGADLFSVENRMIFCGETAKIDTGIIVALEVGFELQVRTKGGQASRSIWVANSPGTSDEGYRGRVFVLIHNGSDKVIEIKKGDKLAQAVVAMYWQANYDKISSFEDLENLVFATNVSIDDAAVSLLPPARSKRGSGALGSTGTNNGK